MHYKFLLTSLMVGLAGGLFAQRVTIPILKDEVPHSYAMFRKAVWRRMDLNEKQNRPFFPRGNEISRLLLEGAKAGKIKAYANDSTTVVMSDEELLEAIRVELPEQDDVFGGDAFGGDGGFGFDLGSTAQQAPVAAAPRYQEIPSDVFDVLYIKEDVIFDRNRSKVYHFIRTLSLALPVRAGVEWNPGGFEKIIVHFEYVEVMNWFRLEMADRAVWYNDKNQASNLNMSEGFELRLFRAQIVKMSNPYDLDIRQEFANLISKNPINAVIIQQRYEYELMQFESQLWEY